MADTVAGAATSRDVKSFLYNNSLIKMERLYTFIFDGVIRK